MKTSELIGAALLAAFALGLMPDSGAADPRIPGRDSYDVTDQNPSWADACRSGWRNSEAYGSCTARGTVRVDMTRTCTVSADCKTGSGGTAIANHRGKASDLRSLRNCDGKLLRTACPPPPPPPEPPHPRDRDDIRAKLTDLGYQMRNGPCVVEWHNAPFVTHRNCWNVDLDYIELPTWGQLVSGHQCKVTATCRTFVTIAGLGRLANDLTTWVTVRPSDIRNIRECGGALTVGACPAGTAGIDRR